MLTHDQLRDFHRELVRTFSPNDMRDMLHAKTGLKLEYIVPSTADMGTQVFEVIQTAERAGWTAELVKAAFEVRPNNAALRKLSRELGLGVEISLTPMQLDRAMPDVTTLESLYDAAFEFRGLERFSPLSTDSILKVPDLAELIRVSARICRIEVGGTSGMSATGFLVGPDAVLTCYHVLADIFDKRHSPHAVHCRFDYQVLAGGTVSAGTLVGLNTTDWLIDSSPTDELNFALIRLNRRIGSEPTSSQSTPEVSRGWLQLAAELPPSTGAVWIAFYAQGDALKMAVDPSGFVGVAANPSRVQYRASTGLGSSGAPCLGAGWAVFAMHESSTGGIKQGIRARDIREHVEKAGKANALGGSIVNTRPTIAVTGPPTPGPATVHDDPQKNRWGGRSEHGGRKLSAKFVDASHRLFVCELIVSSEDGSPLVGPVYFHLHDTFPKQVEEVTRIDQEQKRAVLEDVVAYGVFTVGAQVKDANGRWIGLELDLKDDLPGLPEKFKVL